VATVVGIGVTDGMVVRVAVGVTVTVRSAYRDTCEALGREAVFAEAELLGLVVDATAVAGAIDPVTGPRLPVLEEPRTAREESETGQECDL